MGAVRGRHCLSMTALHLGPRGPIGPLANGGFEVSYVPDDGAEHRVPITQAAWAVPLEHGSPVRRFTSRKGQRHLSRLWWSATTGGHVGFESWLERAPAESGLRPDRGRHRVPAVLAALDRCRASRTRTCRTSSPAEAMARRWWPAGGAAQAAGRREVRG